MRKKMICTLATVFLISAATAFAAVKEGGYSVSPLIGGYIFDNNQQFNSNMVLGMRGGYNVTKTIGIEALYDYVAPTESKYWSLKDISMHRFGAQGLYHFTPDNQLVPYLAAGFSGVKFSGSGVNPQTHLSFDYGVGAKYFVTDDIAVRADLRHILYGYNNTNYNNVEFMLGVSFQFGGVTPAAKPIVTAAASVPEPVKVVATPAAVPEPASVILAPAVPPEPVKAVQPPPAPFAQAQATEVVAPSPVALTAPEYVSAGEKKSTASAATCAVPADTTVLFSYEKTDVKLKYFEELDRVGNFLKSFPGAKVTIEGHTSAMGDKDANLKLSQARADTIKSHIIYKFGIDARRITAKGYGLTKPVASNKTTLGRAQNRRIEAVYSCK